MPDLDEDQTERALQRLEELGKERVQSLMAVDGLPHAWHMTVFDWLAGKVKSKKSAAAAASPPKPEAG